MLLTKGFLDGFIVDDEPNENSVTRIELVSSQTSFKIKPFFPRQVLPDGTQESALNRI